MVFSLLSVYVTFVWSFCLPIVIRLHLSGWNFNSQVSLQTCSLFRSSCSIFTSSWSIMVLKILVSSAKRYIVDFTVFGNSFMYMTNSKGPRTDPWGIPDRTDRIRACWQASLTGA